MIKEIINDKYQIQKVLAESSIFEVFLASEIETGSEVALKILREELVGNEERIRFFSEEVKKNSKLSHPALAQVLDFDVWKDRPYQVAELISGEDLRYWIRSGSISFDEALQIMQEIGEVLFYAFEQDVYKRYLKQSNIFRSDEGKIRILSFSIPRLRLVGQSENDIQAGVQSDLFFLGTLFFELLSGETPIRRRGGINELWDNKLKQSMRIRYEHLEPYVIDKVVEIIEKTFTRENKRRFPEHLAFFRALKELRKMTGKIVPLPVKAIRRQLNSASEVVDAIHGRLPGMTISPIPQGSCAATATEAAPMYHQGGWGSSSALAVSPSLEDETLEKNLPPKSFRIMEGGRYRRTVWKSMDEFSWYKNPMVIMGFGIVFMFLLVLFW